MSENAIALRQDDALLSQAIDKGLDPATLGKLMDLRDRDAAFRAKAEYDLHFSAMQKEFIPVARSKQANDFNGRRLYAYCPLEDILMANAPIIAEHGFSYRWSEETLPNREKRIWCIVAGYGHEEKSYVDIPIIEGSKATNAIQQRGSATSYGKRYSFLNAFGIVIAGEDNDAQDHTRDTRPVPKTPPHEDPPMRDVSPPRVYGEEQSLRDEFAALLSGDTLAEKDRDAIISWLEKEDWSADKLREGLARAKKKAVAVPEDVF